MEHFGWFTAGMGFEFIWVVIRFGGFNKFAKYYREARGLPNYPPHPENKEEG